MQSLKCESSAILGFRAGSEPSRSRDSGEWGGGGVNHTILEGAALSRRFLLGSDSAGPGIPGQFAFLFRNCRRFPRPHRIHRLFIDTRSN